MLSAQLLSQNIPKSLILFSTLRSLMPLTIYPHALPRVLDRVLLLKVPDTDEKKLGGQMMLNCRISTKNNDLLFQFTQNDYK